MEVKQFDILLHDAEVKLKRLKALYEQYFQGIERIEPLIVRKDLDRTFKNLHKNRPRNTAARFKLNQLQASYNTYQTYWGRIARQIEEGTYERGVRRAKRRRGRGAAAADREVKEFELDLEADLDLDANDLFGEDELASVLSALDERTSAPPPEPKPAGFSAFSPFSRAESTGTSKVAPLPKRDPLPADDTQPNAVNPFAAKPVTATFGKPKRDVAPSPPPSRPEPPARPRPPSPPARAARPGPPPPPPRRPPPPPGGENMKKLYADYISARRQNSERTDNMSYDKLEKSVKKMKDRLRQKHGDRKIDFEVVLQNGRVGLKPKIK
ncbi:MAG TPA: hypothetical protein DEF51_09480 [Myxococcales bacterium]|nr:hypothetical protein [Myxococcales bacterium]